MSGPPAGLAAQLRQAGIEPDPDLGSTTGADDPAYRIDPEVVTGLLADGMRVVHSLDPSASSLATVAMADTVAAARARVDELGGAIELDPAYSHMPVGRLLDILADGVESLGEFDEAALVVTHGLPEPATLRCAEGRPVGFSAWEHGAIADPHRDLAHAATAVAATLGPMLVPVLFERYGARPDPRRLDWWSLAGQLTGTATTVRSTGAGGGGA